MKPILIVWPYLPANGMAICPFIFVKSKILANHPVLVNHEKIHIKQQLELLILPFYIAYLLHYVINLIIYQNHQKAYLAIVFEKEAYAKDKNLNYLEERPIFSWISFFKTK
ncbi:MAG TPA: hypothetical protein VL088_13625 [Pedobacter sp.]|nr:hypothetical protein [Pedobacter sp.]